MAFERFTKTKGRGYKPKVSIWRKGQIGFNQGAVRRHNLEKYNFAVLFFDKDDQKIGIRFTNDENEEGAIKVIKRKNRFSISARAFLDYYDINYKITRKYDFDFDDTEDLFVVLVRRRELEEN